MNKLAFQAGYMNKEAGAGREYKKIRRLFYDYLKDTQGIDKVPHAPHFGNRNFGLFDPAENQAEAIGAAANKARDMTPKKIQVPLTRYKRDHFGSLLSIPDEQQLKNAPSWSSSGIGNPSISGEPRMAKRMEKILKKQHRIPSITSPAGQMGHELGHSVTLPYFHTKAPEYEELYKKLAPLMEEFQNTAPKKSVKAINKYDKLVAKQLGIQSGAEILPDAISDDFMQWAQRDPRRAAIVADYNKQIKNLAIKKNYTQYDELLDNLKGQPTAKKLLKNRAAQSALHTSPKPIKEVMSPLREVPKLDYSSIDEVGKKLAADRTKLRLQQELLAYEQQLIAAGISPNTKGLRNPLIGNPEQAAKLNKYRQGINQAFQNVDAPKPGVVTDMMEKATKPIVNVARRGVPAYNWAARHTPNWIKAPLKWGGQTAAKYAPAMGPVGWVADAGLNAAFPGQDLHGQAIQPNATNEQLVEQKGEVAGYSDIFGPSGMYNQRQANVRNLAEQGDNWGAIGEAIGYGPSATGRQMQAGNQGWQSLYKYPAAAVSTALDAGSNLTGTKDTINFFARTPASANKGIQSTYRENYAPYFKKDYAGASKRWPEMKQHFQPPTQETPAVSEEYKETWSNPEDLGYKTNPDTDMLYPSSWGKAPAMMPHDKPIPEQTLNKK